MRSLLRILGHVFSIFGLLVALLFSPRKYDWVEELDPSISAGAIEDPSGNRTVFLFTLVVLIIVIQLAMAIGTTDRTQRRFSLAFIALIVAVSIVKFAL